MTGIWSTQFGMYSSMGDINGDGQCDLVIADNEYEIVDSVIGKIFVFFGGADIDSIPDYSVSADYNDIHVFGSHISCSGDLNNDGYNDIIARGHFAGAPNVTGRLIFLGGAEPDTIPDYIITDSIIPGLLGSGSYIHPDINGDNCDEVVFSIMSYSEGGCLFYGGEPFDLNWDVKFREGIGSGNGITSAGDVNNDGYIDVIISYSYIDINQVFFMDSSLPENKWYDLQFEYPGFGNKRRMGYAGDVNGDGIDDFMMSSGDDDTVGEVFIYSDPTLSVRNPEIELSIPEFTLHQNYPNPFNSSTIIPFTLNRAGKVKINIYDITGRSVGVQYIEPLQTWFPAGTHEFVWNAEGMASGVYLVRLTVDGMVSTVESRYHTPGQTRKVVLIK